MSHDNKANNNGEPSRHYKQLQDATMGLSPDEVKEAFLRTSFGASFTNNPFIQNNRIKRISSQPLDMTKQAITDMLKSPDENEQGLRSVSEALTYLAYPYKKLIKTTQDVLSYRFYNYPAYLDGEDKKNESLLREWKLVDKICDELHPSQMAHQIVGQCATEGKVFYYIRYRVNKSHNTCDFAFMQQLPQDWVKIVGLNNISKYTVAFNLMYFMTPGTDWRQFGDLFAPYMNDFYSVIGNPNVKTKPVPKAVYAAKNNKTTTEAPEVYIQNGTWAYWVTLPIDQIFTFEIDDVSRNVISPYSGLIMSMSQIADYEAVQLAIVQNPLVSVVLAEMACRENADPSMDDPVKISPATRSAYEYLWYSMLMQNNTSGIGFFAAPFENMKLEQLAEAPSGTEIASKGYAYAMQKSGNPLISTADEPRVGALNIAAKIESKYGAQIYSQFENMMNYVYKSLNLKNDWHFVMFGDIFNDENDLKKCTEGMTLGILSSTLRYNALMGHSLLDDISISNAIKASGVLESRLPLISTYSAKAGDGLLPPTNGRPVTNPNEISTEGQEADEDLLGG